MAAKPAGFVYKFVPRLGLTARLSCHLLCIAASIISLYNALCLFNSNLLTTEKQLIPYRLNLVELFLLNFANLPLRCS